MAFLQREVQSPTKDMHMKNPRHALAAAQSDDALFLLICTAACSGPPYTRAYAPTRICIHVRPCAAAEGPVLPLLVYQAEHLEGSRCLPHGAWKLLHFSVHASQSTQESLLCISRERTTDAESSGLCRSKSPRMRKRVYLRMSRRVCISTMST